MSRASESVKPADVDGYGARCFLCRREFGADVDRTEEDVVPKWLLKKLELGNASADLPGGQVFRYAQRRVPCCFACNQFLSRELELPVSDAFKGGYEAVAALPEMTLMLWMAKILYGTRFRETGLRFDLTDASAPAMLEVGDLMARAEYLRLCLLSGPRLLTLAAPLGTLFLYRCGAPTDLKKRFDFYVPTFPGLDFIAVRIGDALLMCVFGDNGYWRRNIGRVKLVMESHRLTLHPYQCSELMLYMAHEMAAYDSSGCYNVVLIGDQDSDPRVAGGVRRILNPQFRVERNGFDQGWLNRQRIGTLFNRIGIPPPAEALDRAQVGSMTTCLVNVDEDCLVQARCFEPGCWDLFERAGWTSEGAGAACAGCGTA